MRLIDADEYIEKLRDRIGIEPTWNHSGLRIAIFELHNMPTINPVKWIPVTERLPEKAGSYLVTLQENENAISLGGDDPFVWVKFFDGRKWHNNSWYDVLAWREKPEPWRGEEG